MHSALPVHFNHFLEIAGSHQKFSLRPVLASHFRQLFFDGQPHLHRINPGRFPSHAGDIELIPESSQPFEKHGGDLQTTLLVHLLPTVSPQTHSPLAVAPFTVSHPIDRLAAAPPNELISFPSTPRSPPLFFNF